MNDHIARNRQLAVQNPEQAIANGLMSITPAVATQMHVVKRSRYDVQKWLTTEGAEACCTRAGQ